MYTVPSGVTQMTSVIPAASGEYLWHPVTAQVELSLNPLLLK